MDDDADWVPRPPVWLLGWLVGVSAVAAVSFLVGLTVGAAVGRLLA